MRYLVLWNFLISASDRSPSHVGKSGAVFSHKSSIGSLAVNHHSYKEQKESKTQEGKWISRGCFSKVFKKAGESHASFSFCVPA